MTKRRHRRLPCKLAGYALVTGASLVGEEARAGIRYTDLGPVGLEGVEISDIFNIDLDGDANAEFKLTKKTSEGGHCDSYGCAVRRLENLSATASLANQLLATAGGFARALPAGLRIDTSGQGRAKAELAFTYFYTGVDATRRESHGGEFFDTRAYLGLTFDLSDGRHAGWVEVFAGSLCCGQLEADILGFAYETIPGKPIAAGAVPEPPSLVLLAAGATGLGMLRRKRRSMRTAACTLSGSA